MKTVFCVSLLSFCVGVCASAQQPPSQASGRAALPASASLGENSDLSSGVGDGLIHIDVTVTDAAGRPVGGLAMRDFALLDGGVPSPLKSIRAIDGTSANADPPTELILIIDPLNLDLDAASAEKALERFLQENGGHLALPTTVYRLFQDGLSVTSERSEDGNKLANELAEKRHMRLVWEHERYRCESAVCPQLHDGGVDDTLSSQRVIGTIAIEARRRPGRKLAVWVGYGWPATGETKKFDLVTEFSTRLREGRIVLSRVNAWDDPKVNRQQGPFNYADYLDGKEPGDVVFPGNLSLEVLAVQSGGGVYGAMQYAEAANHHLSEEMIYRMVADPIARIITENTAYYRLSFDPPRTEHVDEYHDLKVVVNRPGLTAHTNTGYYDEPVYYDQPRVSARRLSVAQLEAMLAQGHGEADATVAGELASVELTERMSSARLASWKSRLPGKKAWQALVAVADASAFLDLPASDLSTAPAPAMAEQREQLSRMVRYVGELAPKLPNLFATRTTDRYEEPKQGEDETWKAARVDRSLHLEASESATVLYRNGGDVVEASVATKKGPKKDPRGLETHGTFGAILATVLSDAVHGKIGWGGWEKGEPGSKFELQAVFRYSVPRSESHYRVFHCCYPEYLGGQVFERSPAYQGRIAFDPATGTILRITVEPELSEKLPLERSDIAVEYGPVEVGGNTYVCPVRSVSITRGRSARPIHEWGEEFETYGPFETILGDVSFRDYHRFGSTATVLDGFEKVPEAKK